MRGNKFTLMELLIVVAMIGILLSLLLPSLSSARMKAMNAVCMGNLRQINTVNHVYMQEHDNSFPVSIHVNSNIWRTWHHVFNDSYMDGTLTEERSASATEASRNFVGYCPAYDDLEATFVVPGKSSIQQPEFTKSAGGDTSMNVGVHISYGINEWLSNDAVLPGGYPGAGFKSNGNIKTGAWYSMGITKVFLAKVNDPGKTMAFSEGHKSPFIRQMHRIYMNPNHGKQANIALVDGSVSILYMSAIKEDGAGTLGSTSLSSYESKTIDFFGYEVSPRYNQ